MSDNQGIVLMEVLIFMVVLSVCVLLLTSTIMAYRTIAKGESFMQLNKELELIYERY